jgi:hypothetical protein
MKKENQFVPNWVLLLVAVLALVAIADMPYDFYRLLRWLTFGVSIALGVEKFRKNQTGWLWSLGIIALIFNPLVPFDFGRGIWRIFNICASVIFLSIFFHGFFESKELAWKRIQAVFKPARLIGALAIILVLAGGWLFYSHQCKVEAEKKELALLEENKALDEKIRLEREKESRRISEERARQALAIQPKREMEEIKKQSEIKRKIEEERLKKSTQVPVHYYPKIEVFDCVLDHGELTGKITNKLTIPVVNVALKISIFKTISGKWHYEKGKGIVKDTEDTKELLTVEHVVIPGPFKTDERRFFEIEFPNALGYSKYEATAEVEGSSYALSPEEIAAFSDEEVGWELVTDPEELKEIEERFKKDDSPSQVPSQK